MTERRLVLYGDPILRAVAEPVTTFDDDLETLVADMYRIMYEEQGIGLAAPQVGDGRRVFVIDIPGNDEDEGVRLTLVNPRIVRKTGSATEEEGCLSLPGIRENVTRATWIAVEYESTTGEAMELEATDLIARAIQHETDHLDGVLITDRLPAMKRALLRRRLADIAAGKLPSESDSDSES